MNMQDQGIGIAYDRAATVPGCAYFVRYKTGWWSPSAIVQRESCWIKWCRWGGRSFWGMSIKCILFEEIEVKRANRVGWYSHFVALQLSVAQLMHSKKVKWKTWLAWSLWKSALRAPNRRLPHAGERCSERKAVEETIWNSFSSRWCSFSEWASRREKRETFWYIHSLNHPPISLFLMWVFQPANIDANEWILSAEKLPPCHKRERGETHGCISFCDSSPVCIFPWCNITSIMIHSDTNKWSFAFSWRRRLIGIVAHTRKTTK